MLEILLRGVDPFHGELRIVLPRSALTTGIVVGPDGSALLHALVMAFDSQGEVIAMEYTDGTGAFALRLVPGVRVDIAAKPPPAEGPFYVGNHALGEESVTLRDVAAGATDLLLELPATSTPVVADE